MKLLPQLALLGCLLYPSVLFSQSDVLLKEDFSTSLDTAPHVWQQYITSTGSLPSGSFVINTQQTLQSDFSGGSGTRKVAFSSKVEGISAEADELVWEFDVQHNFSLTVNTAKTNQSRIFLWSSAEDLNSSVEGYYIMVNDGVSLYRQDGEESAATLLHQTSLVLDQPSISVKVIREKGGIWKLWVDSISQGTVTDNSYQPNGWFGIQARFSAASRGTSFYYDNFSITQTIHPQAPDIAPPAIESINPQADNSISVVFDESIADVNISQVVIQSVSLADVFTDGRQLSIESITDFEQDSTYLLELTNISDTSGNLLSIDTVFVFPDIRSPSVTSFNTVNNQILEIEFSEFISDLSSHYFLLDGVEPTSVVRNQNYDLRWFLLFDEAFRENKALELSIEQLQDDSGNQLDTLLTFTIDTKRPSITELKVLNDHSLELHFSESVDSSTAKAINHYEIQELGLFPETIEVNGSLIQLFFNGVFEQEQTYELTVRYVKDIEGNVLTTKTLSFSYDTLPPILTTTTFLYPDVISLTFSEIINSNISLNQMNLSEVGEPDSIFTYGEKLWLYYSDLGQQDYELILSNIEDVLGNKQPQLTTTFSTEVTELSKVWVTGMKTLRLHYSNPVLTNSVTDFALNNSENPISITTDENNNAIQDLTFTNSFLEVQWMDLSLLHLDTTVQLQYQSSVTEINVISAQTIEVNLRANPSQILPSDFTIDGIEIFAIQRDVGISNRYYLLTENLSQNQLYTLRTNKIHLPDKEYLPASEINFIWDQQYPKVLAVRITAENELTIVFDEPLEKVNSEIFNHYEISEIGISNYADLQGEKVVIQFDTSLEFGIDYNLNLKGIVDEYGNVISDTTIQIRRDFPPRAGELFLNELMVTPTEGNSEYIELYNASDRLLQLSEVRLSDNTGSTSLPYFELSTGEYVVLCPKGYEKSYQQSGHVLGITNWRSLNNNVDNIQLTNTENELIHNVEYNSEWLPDSVGISIELFDYQYFCLKKDVWISSKDTSGGTPGKINNTGYSQFTLTPFNIVSHNVVDNYTLQLTFSRPLNRDTPPNVDNFLIFPESVIDSVHILGENELEIRFFKNLSTGEKYELTVLGIKDCSNRELATTKLEIINGKVPDIGELLFTEIFFDPLPKYGLPEGEFLEIYNPTDKILTTKECQILIGNSSANLPNMVIYPKQFVLLCDEKKVDLWNNYENVVGIPDWKGLNNDGDTISIIHLSDTIFSTYYHPSMLGDKKEGGFSLEMVSPNAICLGVDNWRVSEDPSGGSPSSINSVDGIDFLPEFTVSSLSLVDNSIVHIEFSSEIDESTALFVDNFIISNKILLDSIQIVENNTVEVSFLKKLSTKSSYQFRISGIKDCLGRNLSDSTFIIRPFLNPKEGELLITEIFSDPIPSFGLPESEFMEVINMTDHNQTLSEVKLEIGELLITLPDSVIGPNERVILCDKGDVDKWSAYGITIGVDNWKNLPNSGSKVSLLTENQIINSIVYNVEMLENHSDGGYSLELINSGLTCLGVDNWKVCESLSGGTPGTINSVDNVESIPDFQIMEVKIVDNSLIKIIFSAEINEKQLFSVDNFSIFPLNPISSVDIVDKNELEIRFFNKLSTGIEYEITLPTFQDCAGRNLHIPKMIIPNGKIPHYGDLLITEVLPDPTPSVGMPESEFIEIYNQTDSILTTENGFLLIGARLAKLPNMVIYPKQFLLLCDESELNLWENYENVVGVPDWNSLNNEESRISLLHLSDTISSMVYDRRIWNYQQSGGHTLEMVSPHAICLGVDNWQISNDPSGGSPNTADFVDNIDNLPAFFVSSTKIVDNSTIQLEFSVKINEEIAENVNNYRVSEKIFFDVVKIINPKTVEITFLQSLSTEQAYQLEISDLEDCLGRKLPTKTIEILIGKAPNPLDLLITEIFSDPFPTIGLPESEFLELINNSDHNISTQDCYLKIGEVEIKLPETIIKPSERIILCDADDQHLWITFGRTLGIENWKALNNEGTKISILDVNKKVIFQVNYETGWWEKEKRDGGWSLELIDINSNCFGRENWRASVDKSGGTPSRQNSIQGMYLDTSSPELVKYEIIGNDTIKLEWNESIDSTFIKLEKYNFSLSVKEVFLEEVNPDEIYLILSDSLEKNRVYNLIISGIYDCSGNEVKNKRVELVRPLVANFGEVNLSEILFNPKVGGVDFVEIYNVSDKHLSLQNWQLVNHNQEAHTLLSESHVFFPNSFLILTESAEKFRSIYPTVPDSLILEMEMPSFPNEKGSVILRNPNGEEWERYDYDEDHHFELLKNVEGVSLERIDYSAPVNDANNWRSSSGQSGYATPAAPNSQRRISGNPKMENECFVMDSDIFFPEGTGSVNFTSLQYKCNSAGYTVTITIFDRYGQQVRKLVDNQLLTSEGFYRWDGTNQLGRLVKQGAYLIRIEMLNLSGESSIVMKKVVIGRRF
ncbi:lamin tail domain-containing protein [Limibacter armeniacum]|uniref:lamin tail domain-containing protein n=1 Tax=Limibacter armeniacum TaxID=466084 RepID=UPI002FE5A385